jgi:hypothetical protein
LAARALCLVWGSLESRLWRLGWKIPNYGGGFNDFNEKSMYFIVLVSYFLKENPHLS